MLSLTANEMIATEPGVFVWLPMLSIDGGNPLYFTLRVRWNSEKSFIGALTRSVGTTDRTAGVRHLNRRGDKKQHQPTLISADPQCVRLLKFTETRE